MHGFEKRMFACLKAHAVLRPSVPSVSRAARSVPSVSKSISFRLRRNCAGLSVAGKIREREDIKTAGRSSQTSANRRRLLPEYRDWLRRSTGFQPVIERRTNQCASNPRAGSPCHAIRNRVIRGRKNHLSHTHLPTAEFRLKNGRGGAWCAALVL